MTAIVSLLLTQPVSGRMAPVLCCALLHRPGLDLRGPSEQALCNAQLLAAGRCQQFRVGMLLGEGGSIRDCLLLGLLVRCSATTSPQSPALQANRVAIRARTTLGHGHRVAVVCNSAQVGFDLPPSKLLSGMLFDFCHVAVQVLQCLTGVNVWHAQGARRQHSLKAERKKEICPDQAHMRCGLRKPSHSLRARGLSYLRHHLELQHQRLVTTGVQKQRVQGDPNRGHRNEDDVCFTVEVVQQPVIPKVSKQQLLLKAAGFTANDAGDTGERHGGAEARYILRVTSLAA